MAKHPNRKQSVQEMEQPVVDLHVDMTKVDTEPKKERPFGREHIASRKKMPEKQLFEFAEYQAKSAEAIGFSNYSYWKSVWQNFLKKRSAVLMSIIFFALFAFTFIAPAISKYDVRSLRVDANLAFIHPNGEYWFGTDNFGRDVFSRIVFGARVSLIVGIVAVSLVPTVVGLVRSRFKKEAA